MAVMTNEVVERKLLERERRWGFRLWRLRSSPSRLGRNFRRALHAATRASALFLTIGGVLISIVALAFTLADRSLVGATPWLAIVVTVLLSSFVASGFLVLRMLPAEELAEFLVHGRGTSEILETIAIRIHRLARAFVVETRRGSDLPLRLLDLCHRGGSERSRLIAQAEERVGAIQELLSARDVDFRRIEALKSRAARELGLSQRSLGDHILQFSPAMFRIGVSQYLRNLREMIELTRAEDFEEADDRRFRGLMKQNRRLEVDCRERVTVQELLLRFDDLHADICSLASTRSTSGSLQAYSRALAGLATRQQRRLTARSWRRGWRKWSGASDDPIYLESDERFLFLYRRERAHPGFDLHSLLKQAVDRMVDPHLKHHFDPRVVADLKTAMRAVGWASGRLPRVLPAGRKEDDSKRCQRYIAWLASMRQIHRYFNRIVSLSREAMSEPFCRILDAWCSRLGTGSVVYVVTLGYSKTVRELIRHALGGTRRVSSRRPAQRQVHLFQLLAGDPDELDTRLMAWELRDVWSSQRLQMAAGSGDMLVSLTRRGDRVLVLLGAEAVDVDGRVVHPRSVLDRLLPAVRRLAEAHVPTLAVVAAESFKHHPSAFSIGPLYRGYLERVGIYDARCVDLVLGDAGTVPRDWRRVVRERLRRRVP